MTLTLSTMSTGLYMIGEVLCVSGYLRLIRLKKNQG